MTDGFLLIPDRCRPVFLMTPSPFPPHSSSPWGSLAQKGLGGGLRGGSQGFRDGSRVLTELIVMQDTALLNRDNEKSLIYYSPLCLWRGGWSGFFFQWTIPLTTSTTFSRTKLFKEKGALCFWLTLESTILKPLKMVKHGGAKYRRINVDSGTGKCSHHALSSVFSQMTSRGQLQCFFFVSLEVNKKIS